jgi:hypothetical protein
LPFVDYSGNTKRTTALYSWNFDNVLSEKFAEAIVKNLVKLMLVVALLPCAVRMGFSRGDKIIPQVVDGPGWATKFDLTNVSRLEPIGNMRLAFFKNDGTPWTLQTNQGTGSNFALSLQAQQTLRFETSGTGPMAAGYAVIYDEEPLNSSFSEDYVLGISVFYVVSSGAGIVDTVTVSVPQPTQVATVPLETDDSKGIYSGLSLVNVASINNNVQIDFYRADGSFYGTRTIALSPSKRQWAGYLDNPDLFPGLKLFKGMAKITTDPITTSPVSLLGLLQTRAADGNPQYSTLVPVDKEALRRNTYMVFLQASTDNKPFMPIDLDNFTVDYFREEGDMAAGDTESYPWDLEYRYNSPNTTDRYLEALNGAALAPIGLKDAGQFDQLSLPYLKSLTYTRAGTIDLSDSRNSSLNQGFAFAVRTDIGNYAKVRILRIIDTVDSTVTPTHYNKDLVLEVCIYR